MKTIHFYILRKTLGPMFIGIGIFTILFVFQRLADLVGLTLEKGIPFFVTLKLFIFMLPFTAAITVPMGLLFGVLMSFGTMSSHSEIVAMRANGISIFSIFAPVGALGIFMTLFMVYFINYVVPYTNTEYRTLYRQVHFSNPGILLEDRVFFGLPDEGRVEKKISTIDVSSDGSTMHSVFIFEEDKHKNNFKLTYAESGHWENNTLNSPLITLNLSNGKSLEFGPDGETEVQNVKFERVKMNIFNKIRKVGEADKGLREKNALQIWGEIRERVDNEQEVSPTYWVEFHKKFSIPAACLIFVIVGMPLGISFHRSGKGVSFGMAIILIFLYYILMNTGEALGKSGRISPQMSMWIPNLGILALGIITFIQRAKE